MKFAIEANHPALPGHFPGRPIVPGVVVLEQVLQAVASRYPGQALVAIPSVKFLRPLLPEQPFAVELESQSPGKLRFRCHHGDVEFAAGTLKLSGDGSLT